MMMIVKQHMLLTCFHLLQLLLYVLLLSSLSDGSVVSAKKPRGGFAVKMFHHDSLHSPFYNPNETIADRAKRAADSSLARFAYLMASSSSKNTTLMTDTNSYGTPLKWLAYNGVGFYANISLGQPSVVQFPIVDTGSSLFWVQCNPCSECSEQTGPRFTPSRSSTYSLVPFASDYCRVPKLQSDNASWWGSCFFNVNYGDESSSHGFLATETLTLNTYEEEEEEEEDGLVVTVPNTVFGCSVRNTVNLMASSGVLGIGPAKTSLVSQFGSNFSFCMASLNDVMQDNSILIFGDDARMEGISTPLEIYNDHYYLTLENITVLGKQLDIDFEVFELNWAGYGGTILDTASSMTIFPQTAFDVLADVVNTLLAEQFVRATWYSYPTTLCYEGYADLVPDEFPSVVFHFKGGVELELNKHNLFRQVDFYKFCMSIMVSSKVDGALIGVYALQTYNIGIDIAELKVYFKSSGC